MSKHDKTLRVIEDTLWNKRLLGVSQVEGCWLYLEESTHNFVQGKAVQVLHLHDNTYHLDFQMVQWQDGSIIEQTVLGQDTAESVDDAVSKIEKYFKHERNEKDLTND